MAFHSDADYLRLYKGNWRVRIKVPAECRDRLPSPHTGKLELIKSTGTGNYTHAVIIARPIIAEYQAMIEAARPAPSPWLAVVIRQVPNPYSIPGYVARYQIDGLPMPQTYLWQSEAVIPQPPRPMAIPEQPDQPVAASEERATFETILDTWGKFHNHQHIRDDAGNIVTYDTARTNFGTVFDSLAAFLGHDDPNKVKPQKMNDWLEHLLDTKASHQTIKKYVTVAKRVFKVAKERGKITIPDPCADFNFTPTKAPSRTRNEGFSKAEMALLYAEAWKVVKPLIRITILIAIWGGARLSEIVEAHTKDFEEKDGELVFCIRLDNRPPAQRVKTAFSLRRYPLPRLVADEVRAYLATIPEGPLFPSSIVKTDRYGKLGHNAGEQVRKWLRKLIPDLGKGDAFHRLTHHVHILEMNGDSYRLKQSKQRQRRM